ncbi:hypothetical protein IMG5_025610 [Ichthyophthirius multifiliis]|uniref:Ethanolaminephosphotransferase n=1 Tax=Ichthyophthirius multifiliis TaxID=5932 RepID=G0QL51_ICHMU|nr:hypothetical protein IMG5_025610 [Ichthyophthirius multifiliis]EGR34051.1 hypothetical protein IMG5_025610 [Ichthyophthirius multifiliis]|eukprot:XP_004039355.1 hypothetical protein IMG5_025610 [Ichthyophthirius multifiliis]
MVTFIGFLFIISQYILMMFFDLSMQKELPSWVFLFASISVFIYQTLDALDGKQARRTNPSSPLGQLFDHGCDCFSVPFFILGSAQAASIDSQNVFNFKYFSIIKEKKKRFFICCQLYNLLFLLLIGMNIIPKFWKLNLGIQELQKDNQLLLLCIFQLFQKDKNFGVFQLEIYCLKHLQIYGIQKTMRIQKFMCLQFILYQEQALQYQQLVQQIHYQEVKLKGKLKQYYNGYRYYFYFLQNICFQKNLKMVNYIKNIQV